MTSNLLSVIPNGRRLLCRAALVALLALAALPLLPRPAAAADAGIESEILQLLNAERSSRGLGAVAARSDLQTVARAWTDRMVALDHLHHNPDLAEQAPADWIRLGENVGYGSGARHLHDMWMGSSGHRANILGAFNAVGIGVTIDGRGRVWATVNFMEGSAQNVQAAASACGTSSNPAPAPSASAANGYYVLGSDGGIFTYGSAPFHGSVPGVGVQVESVLMAVTPSSNGYWVLGADGGIFSFGDARFQGSLPGVGVRNTAIDLKSTPTGNGYWILGADGGIFSFGDARFFGSLPGSGVQNTGITMASTPSGGGYWILGTDGGIFSYGDARFHGSVPGMGLCHQVQGVQLAPTRTGSGYYILGSAGQVFPFGDATGYGDPSGFGIAARDIAAVLR